jgi:hypothetical protein
MPTSKMRRAQLANGEIIIIRRIARLPETHADYPEHTVALISRKRGVYGVYSINASQWLAGPYKRLRPATDAYEAILFKPLLIASDFDAIDLE